MKKVLLILITFVLFFSSCSEKKELPVFGTKEFIEGIDKDTVYHTIPFWSFTNQNNEIVSSPDFQDKIYIADFFFTHCPGICPELLESLKHVQQELKDLDVAFISHTVDPKNDTPERLKWYVEKNNIDTHNWTFLTGIQQDIYELGVNGYLVPNQEDALAPGGFLHSEKFMLIDKQNRIRGFYNGTDKASVAQLIQDVRTLIDEQ